MTIAGIVILCLVAWAFPRLTRHGVATFMGLSSGAFTWGAGAILVRALVSLNWAVAFVLVGIVGANALAYAFSRNA